MRRIDFSKRTASGFSLLEVLIAVVVLATGLLALAALQSSLARNSADAKARSRVAALLSNEMDAIRSGGYNTLLDGTQTFTADADCSVADPDSVTAAGCEAAINGLTLTRTVSDFSDSGAGGFAAGTAVTGHEAQFKHVLIQAKWKDATGGERAIEQATVLSALALEVNSPLVSNDPSGTFPTGPKVRQENPFEEGMIPIAIGDGSETAATNPKPVVVGTNKTLIETRFNIFTYRSEGSSALIQQRIETTVIGCRCAYGNQGRLEGVFSQNFRPTYWNGTRYATPEMLGPERPAVAGPAVVNASVNPQSDLCTDCCRDHHDLADDEIKFDPHRTDGHDHYLRTSGNLVASNGSGEYHESCRVIRVDGLWRVASDFKVDHVGFVATGPAKSSQAPDPVYAKYYEKFIVDSLRSMFATNIGDGKTLSERYDEPVRLLNDSSLDDMPDSNDNNDIRIEADPADMRYLHTRALLIDHLEDEAEEAIANALANCDKTGNAKVECVLPRIPFTTINVTELARYNVRAAEKHIIGVIDGGVNFNDPLITQGMVSGRTTAATDEKATANTRFTLSNTALAAISPIDPQDATIWLPTPSEGNPTPENSDEQSFVAINLNDRLEGENFWVLLNLNTPLMSDGNTSNDPSARWRIGGSFRYPCGPTTGGSAAIPAQCQTNSALGPGVALQVIVAGYNYWADPSSTVEQTCPNSNNKGDFGSVSPSAQAKGRMCRRYKVSGASVKDSAGRAATGFAVSAFPGSAAEGKSEETTITFDGTTGSHVKPGEQVNVVFDFVEDIQPVLQWCNYRNLNSSVVDSSDWISACD